MTNIDFLLKTLNLKDEKRTGWELRKIDDPESVADHSWGAALLTLIYGDKEDVDIDHCIKMCTVHDLAEYKTGDFATRANSEAQEISKEDKERLEQEAMDKLASKLGRKDILELWEEYEERETIESKFVKDMDLIDMCLQALKYEKQQRYNPEEENKNFQEHENLDEFFATTQPRLNTETGKQLFEEVRSRYEEVKEK